TLGPIRAAGGVVARAVDGLLRHDERLHERWWAIAGDADQALGADVRHHEDALAPIEVGVGRAHLDVQVRLLVELRDDVHRPGDEVDVGDDALEDEGRGEALRLCPRRSELGALDGALLSPTRRYSVKAHAKSARVAPPQTHDAGVSASGSSCMSSATYA